MGLPEISRVTWQLWGRVILTRNPFITICRYIESDTMSSSPSQQHVDGRQHDNCQHLRKPPSIHPVGLSIQYVFGHHSMPLAIVKQHDALPISVYLVTATWIIHKVHMNNNAINGAVREAIMAPDYRAAHVLGQCSGKPRAKAAPLMKE